MEWRKKEGGERGRKIDCQCPPAGPGLYISNEREGAKDSIVAKSRLQ